MQEALREYSNDLTSQDRALAYEIALGVCRNHLRLRQASLTKVAPRTPVPWMVLLEMGLYQMFFMQKIPAYAAVDAQVRLAGDTMGTKAAGLVNAVLRGFQRDGVPPLPDDPVERLAVEFSHPIWLVRKWIAEVGEASARDRLAASRERPKQWIRANTRRLTAEELRDLLGLKEHEVVGPFLEIGNHLWPLLESPAFKEGMFSVQNPAAWYVNRILALAPGMRMLDACAAPGGKSALALESEPELRFLVAADRSYRRMAKIHDLGRRNQLDKWAGVLADATRPPYKPIFDVVLADAPCSNLGVVGRRPEVAGRMVEEEFREMPRLQLAVLTGASKAVKPGGTLVYATCSLEPEETSAVVLSFLKSNPEFRIDPVNPYLGEEGKLPEFVDGPFLRVRAYGTGIDSFFGARLVRSPE